MKFTAGYTSGQDVLSFTNANGISAGWDAGTSVLSLTGEASVSEYQTALRNVKYENTNTTNPSNTVRTISFKTNDGTAASNSISRNIEVIHENKAPVISSIETANLIFNIGDEPRSITSAISISDIDDNNLSSAVVSITGGYIAGEDVLSFTNADNITGTWNSGNGTLTLTGVSTILNYQKAIRNVKYSNTLDSNPTLANRTITIYVDDGEVNSNSLNRTISINSPPVANDIKVEGLLTVCKTLTGSYTYADAENDLENFTTFRWLRAAEINGVKTAIPGATSLTYTITPSDNDQYLFLEVTPQAKTGSIQGAVVISQATGKIQNLLPTALFSGTASICEGATANLRVTLTGAPPFTLVYSNGVENVTLNTNNLVNDIPVTRAGTYKGVSLIDNLGCKVEDLPTSAIITVKPAPDVKITDLNSAYSLRGSSVPLKGTPVGGAFSGKGVVTSNNTFNPSLAGLEGSPHPIVYTYIDPVSSCAASDTVWVEVIDANASISGLRSQLQ
ncbi:MAG: hypothetical protein HC905_11855, partial [Bacteroidales bacterium]|nr:hypothetical protein [Bacteroidales bacterium]